MHVHLLAQPLARFLLLGFEIPPNERTPENQRLEDRSGEDPGPEMGRVRRVPRAFARALRARARIMPLARGSSCAPSWIEEKAQTRRSSPGSGVALAPSL